MADLQATQTRVHLISKSKGWYDGAQRTALEIHALIHSEVAEATEAVRSSEPPLYFEATLADGHKVRYVPPMVTPEGIRYALAVALEEGLQIGDLKPEGQAAELADAVIRILDTAEANKWSMAAVIDAKSDFNQTRPHRHGGKVA